MKAINTLCFLAFIASFSMLHPAYGINLGGEKKSATVPADRARLIVPSELHLLEIDGREYSSDVFNLGNTVVDVTPGYHEFTVRYDKSWSVNFAKFERLKSAPKTLSIAMKGATSYRIAHRKLNTYREATTFIAKPDIFVVDANSGARVPEATMDYSAAPVAEQRAAVVTASQVQTQSVARQEKDVFTSGGNSGTNNNTAKPSGTSSNTARPSALQMLQYWWEQTGVEEKQRFREWIQSSHPRVQ